VYVWHVIAREGILRVHAVWERLVGRCTQHLDTCSSNNTGAEDDNSRSGEALLTVVSTHLQLYG
jgi:hypothetical protein